MNLLMKINNLVFEKYINYVYLLFIEIININVFKFIFIMKIIIYNMELNIGEIWSNVWKIENYWFRFLEMLVFYKYFIKVRG